MGGGGVRDRAGEVKGVSAGQGKGVRVGKGKRG